LGVFLQPQTGEEKMKVLRSIEAIRKRGYRDAMEAIRESGSVEKPDGGWDSWLINGVGCNEIKRIFGEPVDEEEWSPAMTEKLAAYCEGCRKACEECDAESAK
jgi:hypothetical protein